MDRLEKFIDSLFEAKVSLLTWTLGFCGVMAIRIFIETFIAKLNLPMRDLVTIYIHELFFFIIAFLLLWIFLSLILKVTPQKLTALFFWSAWLLLLPPLVDMARTGGEIFWSFYLLGDWKELGKEFITFFGHLPSGIVYFGTRAICLLSIILICAIVYVKSKSILKTVFSSIAVYSIWFFMGAFPSFFAWAYYFFAGSKKISQLNAINIIQLTGGSGRTFGVNASSFAYAMAHNLNLAFYPLFLLLLVVLFFMIDKSKLWALVKNFRIPQAVYHTGLLAAGMGLGFLAYPKNYNLNIFSALAVLDLIFSVWLAWITSIIVNDIYDFKVDEISNPQRPLPKKIFEIGEYRNLGILFFFLSLLGGLIIDFKFVAMLAIYQFIAWAYSAKPYRLKRFPLIATFTSATASLVVLFMGFTLFSGDQNIHNLSWRIILLILITFTLSLPIKDFKDIEGDTKYGVWTIPVLLGEKKGKLVVAVGVFISFISSVFFLNELRLFWWALLAGAISFLIITRKKTKPQKLLGQVLAVVFIYFLILAKIVF